MKNKLKWLETEYIRNNKREMHHCVSLPPLNTNLYEQSFVINITNRSGHKASVNDLLINIVHRSDNS